MNQISPRPRSVRGFQSIAAAASAPLEIDELPDDNTAVAPKSALLLDAYGISLRHLGFFRGVYYYLSSQTREIVSIKASDHKAQTLLQLAPMGFWELAFPTDKGAINWIAAASWMMEECHRSGLYDVNRVRGRGAWFDDGCVVLHLGDRLVVDGQEYQIEDYPSRFIYEQGRPLPAPAFEAPLTDEEGQDLAELFCLLRWENPLSALLMSGWVVSAMICGALHWRPHAWLSGPSGSGKSWCQEKIINRLLSNVALFVQSATTEAGIRQSLEADALPVIFDEAEAEDLRAQSRMQSIFELARQASSETGGEIRKGSARGDAKVYRIRSQFLFSSIAVSLKQQADLNRVVVLELASPAPKWDADKVARDAAQFAELKAKVEERIIADTPARLFARLIRLIPTIRANIEVFIRAAAKVLGSQRLGDQMGTLLACAYALSQSNEVSYESALAFIEASAWSDHTAHAETQDHERCRDYLLRHRVDLHDGPYTVDDLIRVAAGRWTDKGVDEVVARRALAVMGMAVVGQPGASGSAAQGGEYLAIHKGSLTIFDGSDWPVAISWQKALKRCCAGRGEVVDNIKVQMAGGKKSAMLIPLAALMEDEEPDEADLLSRQIAASGGAG